MSTIVPTIEQVTIAERVWNFIQTHPENHDQRSWFNPDGRIELDGDELSVAGVDAVAEIVDQPIYILPACGTTACYAGWLAADQKLPLVYDRASLGSVSVLVPLGAGVHRHRAHWSIGEWASDLIGLDVWGWYHAPFGLDNRIPHLFDQSISLDDMALWISAIREAHVRGCPVTEALDILLDQRSDLAGA